MNFKFDWNKEFSFAQAGAFIKDKWLALTDTIRKLDSGSIKNVNIGVRSIRINALRLCTAAAVFAVMLALLINMVVLPHTTYRSYSDIEFDTGGEYKLYPLGRDILLLNNSGIRLVNNKGEDIAAQAYTLTEPMVDIAGDRMLLADLGGNNTLNLFNKDLENILTYEITSDILSAKLNRRKQVVAAIKEEGYKGSVVVYNKKSEEIFKWNSGEGYITDVDISDNGKYVAAAQVMSDRDEVYSKIHVLNIKNGREVSVTECPSQLIARVSFGKNGNIIAVGDSKVYGLTEKGSQKYCIDLAGKSPVEYDLSGDKLVFLCNDNRGNSTVELYSLRGKFLGAYTSDDEINNISVYNDSVTVSTSRTLTSLSRRGKAKKNVSIFHDIMNIGFYGNGRNVLVLGGNKADIIRMH